MERQIYSEISQTKQGNILQDMSQVKPQMVQRKKEDEGGKRRRKEAEVEEINNLKNNRNKDDLINFYV